jgi:PAS domain S-box-containing protein
MKDNRKTKARLIEELAQAKARIAALEGADRTEGEEAPQGRVAEKYRELFDRMAEGVAIYEAWEDGEDFVFVDYNKAGQSMDGVARDDALGRKVTEVYPGVKAFGLFEVFQRVWRTGEPQRHPISRYQDGELAFYRANYVYKLPDGHIVAVYSDETKRMQAEKEQRESEKKYRSLVDLSPDPIVILQDGEYAFTNNAFSEVFGYTAQDVEDGLSFLALVKEEDKEKVMQRYEDRLAGKDLPRTFVLDLIAKNKTVIPCETSATHIIYEGRPADLVFMRDISDRRRTEEELRESEAKNRAILHALPDMMFVQSRDGTFLDYYAAKEEELFVPPEHFLGKKLHDVFPREFAATLLDLVEQAIRTGTKQIYEYPLLVADQARHFEARVVAYGKDKALSIIRDITNRKRAEEEKEQFRSQMQHMQKLESLGVLAGGIAHDFNNILMVVLGNADLALSDLPSESLIRPSIEAIVKSSRRAANLCRQMLAYSGKGRFVVEAVDLQNLVEEISNMMEVSISKKTVLRYDFASNLPLIEADASQISQIVMNLVINASEAIGDRSGLISISTGAMHCDRTYLSAAYLDENLPEGLYVYLEVADTGSGMDPDTLAKIFDPFFTTKFTGRGLGLSAVLGIVRGHKGALRVYTEPGRGTTFKVLFPGAYEAQETPKTEPIPEGYQGSGTILMVDDEESVLATGSDMLLRIGFQVLTAGDGREALEIFREKKDEIVCVLLDLTMPHMDGEEAFRELRRIKKDVRVILSSGYNEPEVTQHFVGKGLAGFIQKPYATSDLIRKIREVLGRQK